MGDLSGQEFPQNDAEDVEIGLAFILLAFEDLGSSSGDVPTLMLFF